MFTYPLSTGSDLVRQNIETQISLFMSLSGRFFNTSKQLTALNRLAGQRLIEETAADLQRSLEIRSPADAQSFIGEQSKISIEKIRGYWKNVQEIAIENWQPPEQLASASAGAAGVAAGESAASDEQEKTAADTHHKAHDVDVPPSPLVEKLIANVAADTGTTPGSQA